ncbi:hypothetical protein NLI96_g1017 [Meripilus lineatus]|uniref:Protein kinase domain-containing protein n=1 Tax=Meripilus lineatus TaxID=2056292 RepID=A0AAD5VAW0_9APHY|nr:hypothetical protein NLI96_g1017 [Physisporinus lineatus]
MLAKAEAEQRERPPTTNLMEDEVFWKDQQVWLQEKGYMLRPRYHPNWVPSAQTKPGPARIHEDTICPLFPQVMDAKSMSTGDIVMLKKVSLAHHPYEIGIHQYFSAEPIASHPRNHCVPLLNVLEVPGEPDTVLLVMPLLRSFDDPKFQTIGELIECLRQIFEGVQFMHHAHVAHRDCNSLNIMMDPTGLFPDLYHPQVPDMNYEYTDLAKRFTRTKAPIKYYLIDFGISRKFNPADGPPRELPIRGGDKSAPENDSEEPIDPFPTDVYYLGNMIREDILDLTRGVEFLRPLAEDMAQEDPSKRPNMDEVVERFEKFRRSLWWWQLRARVKYLDENEVFGLTALNNFRHIFRTAGDILKARKALPRPK